MLGQLANPTLKLKLNWVHQSEDSKGDRPVQNFEGFHCKFDAGRDPTTKVTLEELISTALCETSLTDYTLLNGERCVVLMCREVIEVPQLLSIKIIRGVVDARVGDQKLHTPVELPLEIVVEVKSDSSVEGEKEGACQKKNPFHHPSPLNVGRMCV